MFSPIFPFFRRHSKRSDSVAERSHPNEIHAKYGHKTFCQLFSRLGALCFAPLLLRSAFGRKVQEVKIAILESNFIPETTDELRAGKYF